MKNIRLKTLLAASLSVAVAVPAIAHIERSEPLNLCANLTLRSWV